MDLQGEEIVTSYHHYHYQLYGTGYRRLDLKNTWSFDCLCKRCSDPTESGTLVSAVICDKCKFGNMLPKVSTDYKSKWVCDHCDEEAESEVIEQKVIERWFLAGHLFAREKCDFHFNILTSVYFCL